MAKLRRIQEIVERTDLSAPQKCIAVGGALEAATAAKAPTAAPPQADRSPDPIPTALKEADGLGILAPDLAQCGGQELQTFVAEQAAQHQCTPDEILDGLAAILRAVTSGAYGSRRAAVQAIVRPTSGPPRTHIARWRYFGHMIARERDQRKQMEEAC
jgi:hypothetical protein